jgi:aminopeptidase N
VKRTLAALLVALAAGAEAAPVAGLHHDLSVAIDPAGRTLRATDRISLQGAGAVTLELAARFRVERLQLDGVTLAAPRSSEDPSRWTLTLSPAASHRIEIEYAGELAPLEARDHRDTLGALPPMAAARGTFLPAGSGWVPVVGDGPFTYRVAIETPAGQRALVAGRLLSEHDGADAYRAVYELAHPADGIDLMAGPYVVQERLLAREGSEPIRLRTWFHPEIADLSAGYLDACAGYLRLYQDWIGGYPYTEFSVVSSPLPTGFGMPTLTYLGIDVLRLPFIKGTSLGHEVLHNWWGNGVYPDWARGNWSEGLTTFMADYAYKERESEAAAHGMRLDWLRDFAAVPPAQDTPLRAFTSRTHGVSQAVGYNKAAFLFFMLRDELGARAFDAALRRFWAQRRFQPSSWEDLRAAFERESGRDLRAFFAQWLDRTGAPRVRIASAKRSADGARHRLELELMQEAPAFALRVPIAVEHDGRRSTRHVELTQATQRFELDFDARPERVSLDPELRLFRRLAPSELPPILRQAMLDAASATVIASRDPAVRDAARTLADALLDHGVREGGEGARGPLLLIGLEDDVDSALTQRGLPARPEQLGRKGTAQVWALYDATGMPVLCVSARDAAALRSLIRPLPHYGRQSWLVFEGAKAIERGVWPGDAPTVEVGSSP